MRRNIPIFTILYLIFIFLNTALAEEPVSVLAPEETMEVESSFPDQVDEEALDQYYILSVMPRKQDGRLRASLPSGIYLSGANKTLYNLLCEHIIAVAEGRESATDFTFTPAEVYGKASYSAEDLGVEYIKDENGFNPDAVKTIQAIRGTLNVQTVMNCILTDFPFQMYWFGKKYTIGKCEIYGNSSALILSGSVKVWMTVAEDYAVSSVTDGITTYSTYTVDTSYGRKVQQAADKAQDILDEYRGSPDGDKVRGYANEICALTSYNSGAAQGSYPFEYGDPWQLVWVFDDDPETKVVCEGYAKAFDYLCGLGTDTAVSRLIRGYLNNTQPSSAHMWNLVKIEGHTYLVDVCSYDSGWDVILAGMVDGSVDTDYMTACGLRYIYRRDYMQWTDEDLTLAPFSYAEWKAATNSIPPVCLSSDQTWDGYRIAAYVDSPIPFQEIVLTTNEGQEHLTMTGNRTLITMAEDAEFTISGIVDGIETPATETMIVTVDESPQNVLTLPAGSRIEEDAFTGIAAECAVVQGNEIAAGAFDDNMILIVDEIGDWFNSGYRFVVSSQD